MFQKMSFGGIIALIIVGFIILAVLTHASGAASAFGTLFTGVNGIGETLSGTSPQQNTRLGSQSRASRQAFAA
jgi:dolichol kinase